MSSDSTHMRLCSGAGEEVAFGCGTCVKRRDVRHRTMGTQRVTLVVNDGENSQVIDNNLSDPSRPERPIVPPAPFERTRSVQPRDTRAKVAPPGR
jgi:hypothetical protein